VNQLPRRFLLLMAASLALNLFFFGALAARMWLPMHRPELGVHAFLRHSGLEHASPDVQAVVHENRAVVRQRMHELGEARKHTRAALQAEPFDGAQLDAAFEQVRTRTVAMQKDMHKALSDVARQLDAKQRKQMAEALWQRPAGRGGPPFTVF
jgi:uncharacterized membrane protein